jgi:hypothetical protein
MRAEQHAPTEATCRVGKGAGTAFNANERLAYAVPTNGINASCIVFGGHGVREPEHMERKCQRLCPPYKTARNFTQCDGLFDS